MFDVILIKVTDVKEMDELSNGQTVIDCWQDGDKFCLHVERETSSGDLNYETISYPRSAFIRVRVYEEENEEI